MTHQFDLRVYYEDTDMAGIVYYANYLKFIERARSEFIRDIGVDQAELKRDTGLVFAVRRVEADYLLAAKFDDLLTVTTELQQMRGARLILIQDVMRADQVLFSSIITVVCLNETGHATRFPAEIRAKLGQTQT